MFKYHAVSRNDSRNHVRYIFDFPNKKFNRTVEPLKPMAFLTDSDQQESIGKIQGKLQTTAFDQDIFGVWAYSP